MCYIDHFWFITLFKYKFHTTMLLPCLLLPQMSMNLCKKKFLSSGNMLE